MSNVPSTSSVVNSAVVSQNSSLVRGSGGKQLPGSAPPASSSHPNMAQKTLPPQVPQPQSQTRQVQQPKLTPQQIQQLQQQQYEKMQIQKYPVEWQRELVSYIDKCRKATSDAERKQLFSTLNFNTSSRAILEKYSTYPPSMELHIFTNHYRFGSQEGMIDKDDPMIRDFLIHVAREEIPPSMIEILFDSNIKLYEGCVILKITDHRASRNSSIVNSGNSVSNLSRSYSAILKPSPLTFYHDLLYLSDKQNGIHMSMDRIFLELEAKLLPILKPKLDLSVPLNPYKNSQIYKVNRSSFPQMVTKKDENAEEQTIIVHDHRIEEPNATRKKLHEHFGKHNSTEIDEFMSSLANFKHNNNNSKFSRLRLVENFRKNMAASSSSSLASSYPILASKKATNSTGAQNIRQPQSGNSSVSSRKSSSNHSSKKSNSVVSPTVNTKSLPQSKSGKSTAPPTPTVASASTSGASKKKNANRQNSVSSASSGRKNVAGKTLPGQFNPSSVSNGGSAASSPKVSKPQTKKRTYNTKKKREAAERLAKEQEAAAAAAAANGNGSQSVKTGTTANNNTKPNGKIISKTAKNDKQQMAAKIQQQQKLIQMQKQQAAMLMAQKQQNKSISNSPSGNITGNNSQIQFGNSASISNSADGSSNNTNPNNTTSNNNIVNMTGIDMSNFETAFNTMMNNNNSNNSNTSNNNNSNNNNDNNNNNNNSKNNNVAGFDMNFLNSMNFDSLGNIN